MSRHVVAGGAEVAPCEELVKGPYTAEHFSVSTEENYLVVEMW